jgi:hypothetical protein
MRAPLPPCSGFSRAGQRSPHCVRATAGSLKARLRGCATANCRMSAICADLPSSSEKAREPVQYARAGELQRADERVGEGNGARVAADVGAGACLIEVERATGERLGIECGVFEIDCSEVYATAFQGGKERLLPFGMFKQDDNVGSDAVHFDQPEKDMILIYNRR